MINYIAWQVVKVIGIYTGILTLAVLLILGIVEVLIWLIKMYLK